MSHRLHLNLSATDTRHLSEIATAIAATYAADTAPWDRTPTMSGALKTALAVAAEAVRTGTAKLPQAPALELAQ